MGFHLFSASLTALVLNIAAGSIAIASVAVLVARVTRDCGRPLQHGLLLAAFLTILACPLLVSISLARGNGLWQFTVSEPASKTDTTRTDPRMPVDPSAIKPTSFGAQPLATNANQKSIESAEQTRPKSEKPATAAFPAKTAATISRATGATTKGISPIIFDDQRSGKSMAKQLCFKATFRSRGRSRKKKLGDDPWFYRLWRKTIGLIPFSAAFLNCSRIMLSESDRRNDPTFAYSTKIWGREGK